MPLPDLNTFCVKLAPQDELCVQFPGGAKLCATWPSDGIPTSDELTKSLMAQVNTALAPMMPIFDILDVLVAMVNCIKAVEKCLGPPPDPTELVKCFPSLAKAMAKVLQLIPQLSVPVLIGGILDVLIANLKGMRARIVTLLTKQAKILAAEAYVFASGSRQLRTAVDCAKENLTATMVNLNKDASAIGQLVAIVNLLLELAGLQAINLDVSTLSGDLTEAVAPLDAIIATLQGLRVGFP